MAVLNPTAKNSRNSTLGRRMHKSQYLTLKTKDRKYIYVSLLEVSGQVWVYNINPLYIITSNSQMMIITMMLIPQFFIYLVKCLKNMRELWNFTLDRQHLKKKILVSTHPTHAHTHTPTHAPQKSQNKEDLDMSVYSILVSLTWNSQCPCTE